jgi:hypothetical protein
MTFKCPRCHGALVAKCQGRYSRNPEGDADSLFEAIETYPRQSPPIDIPGGLTPDLQRLYHRAADNLRRRDTDAASMLIRKTLDVALKEKFGNLPGTLFNRIKELEGNHLITNEMAQWAEEIRLDGNEATHEAREPDLENTRDLQSFLHVFLLYTFTLPEMIEARKRARTASSN